MPFLLGLDLGTTTIKAVRYDSSIGQVVATAERPTPITHPRADWSEHDPEELWQAACACLREAGGELPCSGLAISSMAEAGLPVDAAGKALAPIIAWFDRRSAAQAEALERQVGREALYRITGQRISPSFGATKWLWLREHYPDLPLDTARWMPIPAYLLQRLCGRAAVDYSIASRSLLFDQTQLDWSPELMRAVGLSVERLPAAFPGGTVVGPLTPSAAGETGLPVGTPCVTGGHDHLCAAFAAGAGAPGVLADSCGTAEAVVLIVDGFRADPAMMAAGYPCYAHVLKGQYNLKGGLKAAGRSIEWLAGLLSGSEKPDYAALEAAAWQGVGKEAGPLWLPSLLESGTPYNDPNRRAALVGLTVRHRAGDVFRGLLESLACWLRHNVETMQSLSGMPVERVILLGGTTRIGLLSQLKADLLNQPVEVPDIPQSAAVGAALLAGMGAGVFASAGEACASLRYGKQVLTPEPGRTGWYENVYRESYLPLYLALYERGDPSSLL
jgi:xylulokinase